MPRVGLALSGGFARGIAHIGVLRVLKEHNFPIDVIAGTSVGALIGAAFASGTTIDEMERQAKITKFTDFGRWTLSRLGLASNQKLEEFLGRYATAKRFEDLRIPMTIAATDLGAGNTVYFTKGDLGTAVRASCAYPGLFVPVHLNGRILVDGFLTEPVPVEGARRAGADIVIAVNLSSRTVEVQPKSMFEVIGRAFSIVQQTSDFTWRRNADVVIEPQVMQFLWDEFNRTPELIAAGESAARLALPAIRTAIASFNRAEAAAALTAN
ncbi:MAG TPA: patatin-like phospholipase family protein [Candidatus Acidoferrum sp.]|nr:patatin-like phospholipase family protein [Candidatus Acidoferrum sp.]